MSERLIQNIFLAHAAYLDNTPQPLKNRKAIYALQHCRTKEMGESVYSCKDQHESITIQHSCRHRSCYLCAQKKRIEWIESQRKRLFNIPHFHVVFTLPHEYLNLWRFNEALFTSLIFKASKETLMELMGDSKYHGVTPGVLMALHTRGRKLDLHPHTHCLVTAGGLNKSGAWKGIDKFLLPVRVMKALYRGKFQSMLMEAFESGDLVLPGDLDKHQFKVLYKTAYKKTWCVHVEERYEHGKGVMLYLARYLKGGPLNPKQITRCDSKSVSFNYKDHRTQRIEQLELKREDFFKRLLTHVPAEGKHTVRFYGLYSTASKNRRERCIKELGNIEDDRNTPVLSIKDMLPYCSKCGSLAYLRYRIWKGARKGNSINKEDNPHHRASGKVQQVDQPSLPAVADTS